MKKKCKKDKTFNLNTKNTVSDFRGISIGFVIAIKKNHLCIQLGKDIGIITGKSFKSKKFHVGQFLLCRLQTRISFLIREKITVSLKISKNFRFCLLAFFQGGKLFRFPKSLVLNLIKAKKIPKFFNILARKIEFEAAIGVNGLIFLKTKKIGCWNTIYYIFISLLKVPIAQLVRQN